MKYAAANAPVRPDLKEKIEAQGAAPNISDKSNRKTRPCFSKALSKDRNQVERVFNRIKRFRRSATGYEKRGANVLSQGQARRNLCLAEIN